MKIEIDDCYERMLNKIAKATEQTPSKILQVAFLRSLSIAELSTVKQEVINQWVQANIRLQVIEAPWTSEQVDQLKRLQSDGIKYTCLGCTVSQPLTPTLIGWLCTLCGTTQNWCHKVDLDNETN